MHIPFTPSTSSWNIVHGGHQFWYSTLAFMKGYHFHLESNNGS